ncbi:exosome complex protein Rrp4 [Candidatus Woesearchaeota archaeon]|nr:exosome complex protein Rrp4 [Candidatus Woesearchaeota archaeon]
MSKILVKEKDIVVPGECLAQGMDYLPGNGTYREGEKIIASRLGLTVVDGRAIKLIALAGKYLPKRGDTIIGQIKEILMSGWMIDTNSAYHAMLSMKEATSEFIPKGADLTHYFNFGDYVVCKITNVTSQKLVDVTARGPGLRKLKDGRVITVNTHKVPRIIGKKGSMVSMIKQATGCKIIVGQNGIIWLQGEDIKMEFLAVNTIKKIEREAHISGLTDRIKEYLEKETGKKITITVSGE